MKPVVIWINRKKALKSYRAAEGRANVFLCHHFSGVGWLNFSPTFLGGLESGASIWTENVGSFFPGVCTQQVSQCRVQIRIAVQAVKSARIVNVGWIAVRRLQRRLPIDRYENDCSRYCRWFVLSKVVFAYIPCNKSNDIIVSPSWIPKQPV